MSKTKPTRSRTKTGQAGATARKPMSDPPAPDQGAGKTPLKVELALPPVYYETWDAFLAAVSPYAPDRLPTAPRDPPGLVGPALRKTFPRGTMVMQREVDSHGLRSKFAGRVGTVAGYGSSESMLEVLFADGHGYVRPEDFLPITKIVSPKKRGRR